MAGLFALLRDFENFTEFIATATMSVRTVVIMEFPRSTGFIVFEGVILVMLEDLVNIITSVFIFFETKVKFAVKTVVEAEV